MKHCQNLTSEREVQGERERRKEQRWPCVVDVAILPVLSEGGFCDAQLMDFSDHGIGLSVSEPISRGEQFILKIKLPELVLLVFTVRCCVPDARRYRIGAEFYGIVGSPNDDAETSRAKFVARLEAAAATPVR